MPHKKEDRQFCVIRSHSIPIISHQQCPPHDAPNPHQCRAFLNHPTCCPARSLRLCPAARPRCAPPLSYHMHGIPWNLARLCFPFTLGRSRHLPSHLRRRLPENCFRGGLRSWHRHRDGFGPRLHSCSWNKCDREYASSASVIWFACLEQSNTCSYLDTFLRRSSYIPLLSRRQVIKGLDY
ncbi:hypothetical protein BC830DRAFT_1126586 [Chytriomyces sp. MP71]|nr:hypothetical protein BC830DRAFT_1126586 [Chytriomyces sp. MP71]